MRAMIVSVGFSDMLALTLSRNHRLFDRICVVTTPADVDSVIAAVKQAGATDKVVPFATDLFTADGAVFNKWRALEAAWDAFGREGWCCHLDVDVIWPSTVKVQEKGQGLGISQEVGDEIHTQWIYPNMLFSPLRRMLHIIDRGIPPEQDWDMLPVHANRAEWPGFTQVFHASDPVLGDPPWHDINIGNAGAADSWFQARWSPENKIRPPWEVLHLGRAGENWLGRTTPMLDGTLVPGAEEKRAAIQEMWRQRRIREKDGRDPFELERIKKGD